VAYAPGAISAAVAEHAVMLMLVALRRLPYAAHRTREGGWPFAEMLAGGVADLDDSHVALVGMGATGCAVTERPRPFGCHGSYHSRRRLGPEREAALGASHEDLDCLLADSGVINAHVPLTPETQGMFGRDAFARMRPEAVFINAARGELVDEEALHEAVASGHLVGAGLDVLRTERGGPSLFADLPRVVVTPHYAGATRGSQASILRMGLANVLRVLAGERPENVLVEGSRL
jgi:phosphoglycerate dehydrogenase-like enzyme